MAGRGLPDDASRSLQSPRAPFSEPRSQRWGPRQYPASLDSELSLVTELRRSEEQAEHRSLPNNLGWSSRGGPQSSSSKSGATKKKAKHFEQLKLPTKTSPGSPSTDKSTAALFTRKRHHTPATIPRTRLPPGTPGAEIAAMESLRQHLSFDDKEPTRQSPKMKTSRRQNPSPGPANNERPVPLQSRAATSSASLPLLEMNETETSRPLTDGIVTTAARPKVNTSLIINRLNQVRDFLKQATAMMATLQSTSSNDQQSSEVKEQTSKISRLVRQLKRQEQAYVELLQRTVAVERDSTLETTPTLSVQSLTEEEKSESASIRDEELQGLRQQHELLRKMLDQQKQLKELQTRQAALLTLQRDAEMRLAEAEEEGHQVPGELRAEGNEHDGTDRRRGTTAISQASQLVAPARQTTLAQPSSGVLDDGHFTPQEMELMNLLRKHKEKWRSADSGDEKERDESENQRRKRTNQAQAATANGAMPPEISSLIAENEEALANATQERLELENKLMVLEAKKEQMGTLLKELRSLREAQLKKESLEAAVGTSSSVNESKLEEDEPLATTSEKLDDERILEALEVHEKLQRLQDVRDRLKQLRDLIGNYQAPTNDTDQRQENALQTQSTAEQFSLPIQSTEDNEDEELEGAVGGTPLVTEQDLSSIEWILSAGVEDPDLMGKIKQLQEARARVAHLFKQTNENPQPSPVRVNNEALQTRSTEEESGAESQTDTDAESAGSSNANALAWQDDPEFQAKVRKLNSAKQKLKQLQALVKKIQQFPEASASLPAELAEISLDEEDFETEDEDEDDEDNADNETDEGEGMEGREESSNRSEGSDTNDGDVRNEAEDVTTGTEDEEAGSHCASIKRNRMLDLEGWFLGSDQEAVYQRYLRKQTAELNQLQQERQTLLEVQQELTRLSQPTESHKAVATQTTPAQRMDSPRSLFRNDTFTVGGSKEPVVSAAPINREISTQTPFYGSDLQAARSVDSSEPPRNAQRARPSALVWSELRRQRELHEEKLKRRKQKILEKRKKAGLDDLSEGGTYSVRSGRSGDIDEGFGVSMMSADITTATWGGSTQPSSTQNDSAVSADESDEETPGAQIAVEVEDDYPDGIVQAEEEEEERMEPEAFAGGAEAVFRSRERAPRISSFQGSVDGTSRPGKKRKIDGTSLKGGRKRDRERGLTFEDWPRTFYFDRNSRGRIRQENFTPAEQLIKDREQDQFSVERQAWEEHCERLHQEVSSLSTLCNGLLRDQQMLVSTVIGRSVPSAPSSSPGGFHNIHGAVPGLGGNPFEQYQQRQQEAYQGLQTFFDQQRYMQQQYQILRSLNQCYAQLQQQHQDMAVLQQQFQELFSYNPSSSSSAKQNDGSPSRPQTASPNITSHASPLFMNLPSSSLAQPPFSAPLMTQPPVTFAFQPPSSAPVLRTGAWYPSQEASSANENTQTSDSRAGTTQNARTGIPSPRAAVRSGHPVEPAPPPNPSSLANSVKVVREVGASTPGMGLSPGNIRTGRKYDPSSYQEVDGKDATASQKENKDDVIGRTFNTPLRASAAANLAQKDKSAHKSTEMNFLMQKSVSVETSSRASSVPGEAQDMSKGPWQDTDRASEAGSEFSLFEALRDSIYSEVATLISLNESRPHFLLELFRELQLLTSDYLRQRALYALQDLVTRFLTEDSVSREGAVLPQARFQEWLESNSELTPSETVETLEDDESETREGDVPAPETVTEGIYDYVENVESGSTLSTPTSSHAGEAPFASEGLGDTVIHLDKALSRMREYERLRTEGKLFEAVGNASTPKEKLVKDDLTTSSAGDVGSESSVSDVQYPRIDTQALDHLIKSIMSEVIPYLNEHMEDSCSAELLGYVKNLVLARIQVNEEQEFGRFFHKQLASILQDSLSRFKDKKMKDVGEDMLVDMSEILFNELAFFRLMQDLDGTRGANRRQAWRQGFDSASTDTGTGQDGDKEDGDDTDEKDKQQTENSAVEEEANEREEAEGEEEAQDEEGDGESSDEDSSSSEESGAEDEGADDEGPEDEEDELDEGDAATAAASSPAAAAMPLSKEQQEAEEEELGKARDDVMANNFEDKSSRLHDSSMIADSPQCVKLELSVSESKPFSSFGSGEEDGEESFDDSEARRKLEEYKGSTAASASVNSDRQASSRDGSHSGSEEDGAPQDEQRQAVEAAAEAAAAAGLTPYMHNGQVLNDQEDNVVTLDDLPTKLTGLTEADLQARIAEEQSRNEGSSSVLAHLDGFSELAGDAEALREPESFERPLNGLHLDSEK